MRATPGRTTYVGTATSGRRWATLAFDHAPGGHGFCPGDSEQARDSIDRIFAFPAKHLKP
jgi:hypothetical protein